MSDSRSERLDETVIWPTTLSWTLRRFHRTVRKIYCAVMRLYKIVRAIRPTSAVLLGGVFGDSQEPLSVFRWCAPHGEDQWFDMSSQVDICCLRWLTRRRTRLLPLRIRRFGWSQTDKTELQARLRYRWLSRLNSWVLHQGWMSRIRGSATCEITAIL